MTTQITNESMGKAIRRVRKVRGFKQQKLADKIGFKQSTLSKIENGTNAVSMDSLNAIAKALNVPTACFSILASKNVGSKNDATEFLLSLKDVIISVLDALEHLGKEKGKKK